MDNQADSPLSPKPYQASSLTEEREMSACSDSFTQAFNTQADLTIPKNVVANLVCKQGHDRQWSCALTHIQGEDVVYLLGKFFDIEEEIPLDLLIPAHMRVSHSQHVNSILNEEYESEYWEDLFQKMMNRDITILCPQDHTPRLVNIFIRLKQSSHNTKVFEITLTDKTAENTVANNAGLMSHNLRTTFRAIINHINEPETDAILQMSKEQFSKASPEQLDQLYESHVLQRTLAAERAKDISVLAYEGLACCASTRKDFSATHVKSQKSAALDELYQERLLISPILVGFIEKRRVAMSHIKFMYANTSTGFLERYKIDILMNFLWNLFLNASQAMRIASTINPEIMVNTYDRTENNNTVFHCECIDNGPGMTEFQHQTFFKREFPIQSKAPKTTIESNRGEGTLMAYKQWRLHGGEAVVSARTDDKSGTRFQLSCSTYSNRFFISHSLLNPEQMTGLDFLSKNTTLSGIILLADDQYMILKILMKLIGSELLGEFFDSKMMQLSTLKNTDWTGHALTTDIIGSWGIICASNGRVAYEVVQRCANIKLVITDLEMPEMNGVELIHHIRAFEQENGKEFPTKIVLNTGVNKVDLEEQVNFEELAVEYMLKDANRDMLKNVILDIVRNKTAESVYEKGLSSETAFFSG